MILTILLVPSGACRPVTKPTWSGWTREGRTRRSRLAKILAYNLISEFSNEIGLKFAGVSGVFPGLGRVTIVA